MQVFLKWRFIKLIWSLFWFFRFQQKMPFIKCWNLSFDLRLEDIVRSSWSSQVRIRAICDWSEGPGYRFTKGLTQNLNLRRHFKLEYNVKSLNYIQQNFRFQASFLFCWTLSFYFFDMISGLKVIKIENECVTLQFA